MHHFVFSGNFIGLKCKFLRRGFKRCASSSLFFGKFSLLGYGPPQKVSRSAGFLQNMSNGALRVR